LLQVIIEITVIRLNKILILFFAILLLTCREEDQLNRIIPTIEGVSPLQGVPGDIIKITGSGFRDETKEAEILFSGASGVETKAQLNLISETEVNVVVPELQAGYYELTVRFNDQKVKYKDQFELVDKLTVLSFTPEFGLPAEIITMKGDGFSEKTKVYTINGLGVKTLAKSSLALGEISFAIPNVGSDVYTIKVEDGTQQVNASNKLKVFDFLRIEEFTPTDGFSASTEVNLTGTGFENNSNSSLSIKLFDVTAKEYMVNNVIFSEDKISFTIPELFPGDYTIKVSASNQLTTAGIFKVKTPEIVGISTDQISSGVGQLIINGNGFSSKSTNNSVTFIASDGTEFFGLVISASVTQLAVRVSAIGNSNYDLKIVTGPSEPQKIVLQYDANITIRPQIVELSPSGPYPKFSNKTASNNFPLSVDGLSSILNQNSVKLIDLNLGDPGVTQDVVLTVNEVANGVIKVSGGPYASTEVYRVKVIVNGIESVESADIEIFEYPNWTSFTPNSFAVPQTVTVTGTLLEGIQKIDIYNTTSKVLTNISTFSITSATSITFDIPVSVPSGTYTMFVEKPSPLLNKKLRLNWSNVTLTVN
jgi:IPT/TIG domain